MLELLINPRRAEKRPWEMVFVGIFYAALSLIIANLIFGKDPVLSKYMGIFIVMFCVIFSMPFMYYSIKLEERKDLEYDEELTLLKEHGKAILMFLCLFMGYIIAFSAWYVIFPENTNMFRAQIETFCQINQPGNFNECIGLYGLKNTDFITGAVTASDRLFAIFANNIYVLIFTLILSLIFGAGALFILAWNASVIAAAIGIFAKSQISQIPTGIGRYMLFHGWIEIAAYFIAALAGGILSTAIIRHDTKGEKFWSIIQDSINLIVIAIIALFIAAIIEVFIIPRLF